MWRRPICGAGQHFDEAARRIIENSLYLGANPEAAAIKLQSSNTLRRRLVTDVTRAAQSHALATGLVDVDTFSDIASDGIGIVNGLNTRSIRTRGSTSAKNAKRVVNWNIWKHDERPYERIKDQGTKLSLHEWREP